MPRSTRPGRWLLGALTVLTLALVLVVAYRGRVVTEDNSRGAERVPVLGPYAVTIVPGVHLLGGLSPAAAYVVETSEGLVLIDAGLDSEARLLRDEMASLGLDWRSVRAIFLTHVHGDHCGGAQYLRAATGAKVYAGRGDAGILRAGRPREAFFSTFPMREPTPGPTIVDVELDGDQVVVLGGVRFQALATPGHTPGSTCYLMERGEQRVLFSGDVIWSLAGNDQSRSPLARPLGTYSAYLAPRYRGNVEDFLSTLRRLRALPAPQLVLPGHPRNDPVPMSPTMSQERWEALLDAGIREMEQLQTRYARDGAPFLDGVPKQLLPNLYYLGEDGDVAVYGFFASSRFFVVNAPGGPGLGDFLSTRLRQLGLKPAAPTAVLLTSGNPEGMAGLGQLIDKDHPQVVAPRAAWEALQHVCPPGTSLLAPEDLPHKGWFPVQTIPLAGRGVAPVAYLVSWADKAVLFSGQIPVKLNQSAWERLVTDFTHGHGNVKEYRASLQRLGHLSPDLWLPAFPSDGQNAHLYDSQWQDVLAENRDLFR